MAAIIFKMHEDNNKCKQYTLMSKGKFQCNEERGEEEVKFTVWSKQEFRGGRAEAKMENDECEIKLQGGGWGNIT